MAFGAGAGVVTATLIAPFGEVPLAAVRALDSMLAILWVAMAGLGAAVTTLAAQELGAAERIVAPSHEGVEATDGSTACASAEDLTRLGSYGVRGVELAAWRLALPAALGAAILLALLTSPVVGLIVDDPRVAQAAGAVAWLAWRRCR